MTANRPEPVTGEQYAITAGDARAVVTELAGGLRLYERAGVQLTETYDDGEIAPGAAGILLAPWTNRVRDGRWELNGSVQQLDITEPSRGNASHGLLRNTGYALAARSDDSVELRAQVFPQHGYPFRLEHGVRYALDAAGGLSVTQTLINKGSGRAPFALGAHPYLRLGAMPTAELILTVAAGTMILSDSRKNATGSAPVAGDSDLRTGRRVADLDLDTAFTDLTAEDGRHRHVLTAPDGRTVALWTEDVFPYVHVLVTDQFPGVDKAVALEPMTAPADAFNSGAGLRWLEPGATFSGSWGIEADLG